MLKSSQFDFSTAILILLSLLLPDFVSLGSIFPHSCLLILYLWAQCTHAHTTVAGPPRCIPWAQLSAMRQEIFFFLQSKCFPPPFTAFPAAKWLACHRCWLHARKSQRAFEQVTAATRSQRAIARSGFLLLLLHSFFVSFVCWVDGMEQERKTRREWWSICDTVNAFLSCI